MQPPRNRSDGLEEIVVVEKTERLLTPREVALMFRVDPKTVTRWASAGRIRSVRTPGGHRRFFESDVHGLLTELTDHSAPADVRSPQGRRR